jgi:C4-dicarboxylate-specific signal transduction histidine kinase
MNGDEILIIEDSPTQAEQLRYILEKHRYRVATAFNARDALSKIAERKPSLIISDIVMPEMDGYELCRRIKEDDASRTIPVILLTTLSDPRDIIRGLECGADNFITKPYNENYLVSRIKQMQMDRHQPKRENSDGVLEVNLAGQDYVIKADCQQILNLFLSTYETAIQKNRELSQARDELAELNEHLEMRVAERTEELSRSVTMLQEETGERMRAMEALREKEQLLQNQSRLAAMGEMINNIAHQWRQPLNNMSLTVQILREVYHDGECSHEYMDDTVNQVMRLIQHMSHTIDDFRNFFKPDREMGRFNLKEKVCRTLVLVKDSFKVNNISVDVKAEEDLFVTGYPNEYCHVLLNILNNARDALVERAVGSPRITIHLFREDSRIVATISDNAGGIPDAIIDRVFEPYFTTKDAQKGTGIGLYMAKTIIEKRMNGTISVRNTDEGAEFRIEV